MEQYPCAQRMEEKEDHEPLIIESICRSASLWKEILLGSEKNTPRPQIFLQVSLNKQRKGYALVN